MSSTNDTSKDTPKNRFALKLLCCILEILSCVLFNPITLVLAIIALVFTVNANRDYKRGDIEAYRGQAKTATALLIAGLVFDLIFGALCATTVQRLNQAAKEKGYDTFVEYAKDRLSDEESGEDASPGEDDTELDEDFDYVLSDPEAVGDYWKFTLDGHEFALPNALSEYLDAGYTLPDEDAATTMIDAKVTADRDLTDASGENYIAELELYNPSDEAAALKDCVVIGFTVYELEDYDVNFVHGSKLTFGSTAADAVAAFGEPGRAVAFGR